MNRLALTVVVSCATLLAACSRTEVVVQGQLEGAEGQAIALRDLPLRILPYDRDAIFDSLRAAYPQPEPEIPADLMLLQDSIARAQGVWRDATARWNAGRDSLQRMNQRLAGMSRASGDYVVLFRQVNQLFDEVATAERVMNQSFERMTNLNNRFASQAQELRLARDQWGDAAYQDVDRVIAARLKDLRREAAADTLDANGVTRIRGLSTGQWWVTAHYDLPFEELYWNIPVNVTRGEPATVQLTRQTAEVRPKL
ncbi:hypothetical protein BH23GEM9_BH23GEM9_34870 [soil metagenome]